MTKVSKGCKAVVCENLKQKSLKVISQPIPILKRNDTVIKKIDSFGRQAIRRMRLEHQISRDSIIFISMWSMMRNNQLTCGSLDNFIFTLKKKGCKVIFFSDSSKTGQLRKLSRFRVSPTPRLKPKTLYGTGELLKGKIVEAYGSMLKAKIADKTKPVIIIGEKFTFLRSLSKSDFPCIKLKLFKTSFWPSLDFEEDQFKDDPNNYQFKENPNNPKAEIYHVRLQTNDDRVGASNIRAQTLRFKLEKSEEKCKHLRKMVMENTLEDITSVRSCNALTNLFKTPNKNLNYKQNRAKKLLRSIVAKPLVDKDGYLCTKWKSGPSAKLLKSSILRKGYRIDMKKEPAKQK